MVSALRRVRYGVFQELFTDPAWLGVNLASLALIPQVVMLGRWLWRRSRAPYVPRTQVQQDRENYGRLLQDYESNLLLLESLIVIRSQTEAGSVPWTPELEQHFAETRDGVYNNLERRGNEESSMGILQKLDILEGRTVSLGEARQRRAELQARQAEIESHRLFIKRPQLDS